MTKRNRTFDFHTHSFFSDGALSPEELVAEAKKRKVKAFSLTDHGTTAGLLRLKRASRKAGIMPIPGIELGCGIVDILGYHMNYRAPSFQEHLSKFREAKTRFFAAGGKNELALAIEAIRLIRAANGIPVLAHSANSIQDKSKLKQVILLLKENGLMGLEVFHRKHTPNQKKFLAKLATKEKLLITGGSDFHTIEHPLGGISGSVFQKITEQVKKIKQKRVNKQG